MRLWGIPPLTLYNIAKLSLGALGRPLGMLVEQRQTRKLGRELESPSQASFSTLSGLTAVVNSGHLMLRWSHRICGRIAGAGSHGRARVSARQ
jgi:hypothetical protein